MQARLHQAGGTSPHLQEKWSHSHLRGAPSVAAQECTRLRRLFMGPLPTRLLQPLPPLAIARNDIWGLGLRIFTWQLLAPF